MRGSMQPSTTAGRAGPLPIHGPRPALALASGLCGVSGAGRSRRSGCGSRRGGTSRPPKAKGGARGGHARDDGRGMCVPPVGRPSPPRGRSPCATPPPLPTPCPSRPLPPCHAARVPGRDPCSRECIARAITGSRTKCTAHNGYSVCVRLHPPGVPGKWTDATTGEHRDRHELLRVRVGTGALRPVLHEPPALRPLPVPAPVPEGGEKAAPAVRIARARRLLAACRSLAGAPSEAFFDDSAVVIDTNHLYAHTRLYRHCNPSR